MPIGTLSQILNPEPQRINKGPCTRERTTLPPAMLPPRDGVACASLGNAEVKEGRGLGGFGFRAYCLGLFACVWVKGVLLGFGFRRLRSGLVFRVTCLGQSVSELCYDIAACGECQNPWRADQAARTLQIKI